MEIKTGGCVVINGYGSASLCFTILQKGVRHFDTPSYIPNVAEKWHKIVRLGDRLPKEAYCMMCCSIIKVSAEKIHCRNYLDFDGQCGR